MGSGIMELKTFNRDCSYDQESVPINDDINRIFADRPQIKNNGKDTMLVWNTVDMNDFPLFKYDLRKITFNSNFTVISGPEIIDNDVGSGSNIQITPEGKVVFVKKNSKI